MNESSGLYSHVKYITWSCFAMTSTTAGFIPECEKLRWDKDSYKRTSTIRSYEGRKTRPIQLY